MRNPATPQQLSPSLQEQNAAVSSGVIEAAPLSVQDGYKRWAETYDKTPNPLLALEERALASLIPNLVGSKVLDLACGTGRWLAPLLSRGAHAVIGIDFSTAMLEVAQRNFRNRNCLVLANGFELPFGAAIFDFVLSSFALNHFEDLQALAMELARVMRLEGLLLLSEMHPDACARGWRPGFRDIEGPALIETVNHPAERVISILGSKGLAFIRSHDLFFAEAERPVFLASAKGDLFDRVCQVPAIQVYEFRRRTVFNVISGC